METRRGSHESAAQQPVDPYSGLAWMREHCPVGRIGDDGTPGPNWLVTSYEIARSCLLDNRLSGDPRHSAGDAGTANPFGHDLQELDLPAHARIRASISSFFSARAVEPWRPLIERISRSAVDAFARRGRAELYGDYALIVSSAVIHDMLAVPEEMRYSPAECIDLFMRASVSEPPDPDAVKLLQKYIRDIVDHRRRNPGDDLITSLIGRLDAGELNDENELLSLLYLLFGNTLVTVGPFLGSAILRLLEHPAQLARLLADPGGWAACVEEVLRYDSPTQATARYVSADLEVGGVKIKQGEGVLVSLAAANRDPAQFTAPETFDIGREPRSHLAFGHGLHFCTGSHLARTLGEIALRVLFETLSDLRLEVPFAEIPWRSGPMVRSPEMLPVTFEPVKT